MAVQLLGPLQVEGVAELAPRDRVVLAALALRPAEVVSAERLADALWGESPPASWRKVVQGCVLRVRRVLEVGAIETVAGGYRLALGPDEVDVCQFERLVGRGRSLLAAGEPDRAAVALRDALELWRGQPLPDLQSWPDGRIETARLEELRHGAQEDLVAAELGVAPDVAAASALVAQEPLRERRWVLLARALYLTGRQAEALAELRRARELLRGELGLDPGAELLAVEGAILRHDPGLAAGVLGPDRAVCPYRGLAGYDAADAEWFFGREAETAECVRAVGVSGLLLVVGPSGCGKSSLVRAGVVRGLAERGRPAVVVTPGAEPSAVLAGALAAAPASAALVVDQLEELFTAGHRPEVVKSFLERLVELAAGGRPVAAVLRSDHVGGLAAAPAFARLAERCVHLLTPMTEVQLRAAIERPAGLAGVRLEPGMVELLLREVEGEPGALPLLSHALAETWYRREGRTLTVDCYRATGGIRGAVAQTAEQLYDGLPPDRRRVLREVLLRLVIPSSDGDPVAARVSWAVVDTDPRRREVVAQLVRARLLTADEHSVVLAHEALIQAWPRLRTWLEENAAGSRALRHLTLAADDWNARGRPDSELYRGARLADAVERRRDEWTDLTVLERGFLDASAARAMAEEDADRRRMRQQARQNRRLRVAVVAVAAMLVAALIAGAEAVRQRGQSARTAEIAQVDRLVAESAALRATHRDLAALLAVEAHRRLPSATTAGALFGTVTAAPGFLGYRPLGSVPLGSGAVLPDGRTLLAVGPDAVVRAVDLDPAGGPARGGADAGFPAPGLDADGGALGLSADGGTAAVLAWQGSPVRGGRAVLSVVDVASRQLRLPQLELTLDAGAVAVGPDGRFVAVSGGRSGRVLVVDTATEDHARQPVVIEIPTGLGTPTSDRVRFTAALAFRPDGTLLAGSPAGVLRVVNPATGTVTEELTGAPGGTSDAVVAVTTDEQVLVSTGSGGVVRWDAATGRPTWARPAAGECERAVVAETVGAVLCADASGSVRALDLATGLPTGDRYDLQRGPVSALLLTPDGTTLVELGAVQPVLAQWRLDRTSPLTRRLPVDGIPLGYSHDGRLLAVEDPATSDRSAPQATVIEVSSGAVVDRLDGYTRPVWTEDPSRLVAFEQRDGTGYVLDVRSHRPVLQLNGGFGSPPHGAALVGDLVLAWGEGDLPGTVSAWDLRTGNYVGRTLARAGEQATISPDGTVTAVVRPDERRLVARDLRTGALLAERAGVATAAITPAGHIVGATPDGRLEFLDLHTLDPLGPPVTGLPAAVEQIAFSADGRILAVRGTDNTATLIDVPARALLGGSIAHRGPVDGLAVRPDGAVLALHSQGGILLWDLRPASWEAAACRIAGRDLTPTEWHAHMGPTAYHSTCI
jgi:DNA-binding SARP family transcriptional activator/WD40 repeat protein